MLFSERWKFLKGESNIQKGELNPVKSGIEIQITTFVQNGFTTWCLNINIRLYEQIAAWFKNTSIKNKTILIVRFIFENNLYEQRGQREQKTWL